MTQPSNAPVTEDGRRSGGSVVFFCVRADSDADHMVPVVDAFRRRNPVVALRLVVYDGIKTYRDDFRFRYLSQTYGIATEHIFGLPGVGTTRRLRLTAARCLFTALLKLQRRFAGRLSQRLTRRPLHLLQEHLGRSARDASSARALIAEIRQYSGGVVVFDHTMNPLAQAVSAAVRGQNFRLAALPHSIPHVSSLLRDPTTGKAEAAGKSWTDVYDVIAVPNEPSAQRLVTDGTPADRVVVLGSPRFATEWSEVLDRIAPPYDWMTERPKVLFVLSKHGRYVDWEGVNRVVSELARDGRMAVAIKPHTRTETNGLPDARESALLRIVGPEVSTCSLIRWADLVVFWGTSVIYDALRRRKPTLHLAYLIRLNFDFESHVTTWRTNGLDEFRDRLDAFLHTGDETYSEVEAAACLAALAGDESESSVADRYSGLLEALLAPAGTSRTRPGRWLSAGGLPEADVPPSTAKASR